MAPDGSQYAGQIVGSGFTARLYLVRERPSPSGQVTLTVGMAALPGKDSRFGAGLVGATDEELSVSAVTSSGTIGLNGFLMTPGMLKGGGGFAREDFGLALALPPGTTSLRFTVHLGLTKAAARTGASVEVPLSVVPVVSRVLPFKGLTPAFGGGHLATPAVP